MIYRYKIKFYFEDQLQIAVGFCVGENYTDVVSKLSNYYGEKEIESFDVLALIGEGEVIELSSVDFFSFTSNPDFQSSEKLLDKFQQNFIW